MARREASPDFTGALARGLDVIRAFQPRQPVRSLTAPATAGGLARPAARRVLPLNVTVHAAQTPVQTLTGECLPLLLQTAGAIGRGLGTLPVSAARHRATGCLDSQYGRQQTAGLRTSVRSADSQVIKDQQEQ
jgi:hypothetical protein